MNEMEAIELIPLVMWIFSGTLNLSNGNKYIAAACFFAAGLNFGVLL